MLFQFISVLAILTQLLFYLNIRVGIFSLLVSAAISVILLWVSIQSEYRDEPDEVAGKRRLKTVLAVVFISLLVILVSVWFAISFFDATHDSNNYHKPYAIFFASGFNPVFDQNPPVVFGIEWKNRLFVQFPKAAEIIGSYFYYFSGMLESVKAINLIAFISAIIIAFFTFLLFLPGKRLQCGILAAAAALSPVWITQSTQFYIDGFYYEAILIVICLMFYFLKTKGTADILATIVLGLVLLVNTKGSSLLFVPIFIVLFCLLLYLYKPDLRKGFIVLSLFGFVLLVILTGYPTYLANYSRYLDEYSIYMNPLGENAVLEWRDTAVKNPLGNRSITGQTGMIPTPVPPGEAGQREGVTPTPRPDDTGTAGEIASGTGSQISKWLLPRELAIRYHFSPVSQEYTGMKSPLDINMSELSALTGENRVNGYGPFLGLILIVMLLTLLSALIFREPGNSDIRLLGLAILFIFASVVLHPAVFWDRYVPQLYLVIVFIALTGFLSRITAVNALSYLLLALLLVNAFCVGAYWYPDTLEKTREFNNLLDGIQESSTVPVYLIHSTDSTRNDISEFYYRLTNIAFFQERGIPWRDGTNETIPEPNFTVPLFFETDAIVIPKSTEYRIGDLIPPTVIGRYAVDGFAPTQAAYIWTDKRNVSLKLTITDPPADAYLLLNALPFHQDKKEIDQILWITVNNLTLQSPYRLTGTEENRLVIPLPSRSLVNGTNVIRFTLPYAQKLSKGMYGMSVRSLGITGTPPAGSY
jgi:4-amino-4-deoxy-L-arabinose transferase-like glycosyltransferase